MRVIGGIHRELRTEWRDNRMCFGVFGEFVEDNFVVEAIISAF